MALPEAANDASKFSQSCEKWADYPNNLVYPAEFEHELISYQSAVNDSKKKLFHPTRRVLHMLNLEGENQGESCFNHNSVLDVYQLTLQVSDHVLTPNLKTKAEIQQFLTPEASSPIERYM